MITEISKLAIGWVVQSSDFVSNAAKLCISGVDEESYSRLGVPKLSRKGVSKFDAHGICVL